MQREILVIQNHLDLMNVLGSDDHSWRWGRGTQDEVSVLFENSTFHCLATEPVSTQLPDQLVVFVLELVHVTDEQLVLIVMHLMAVFSNGFVLRVEVRDDVPKLNQVLQSKGELRCKKLHPTQM
jgi:hypothetical protein